MSDKSKEEVGPVEVKEENTPKETLVKTRSAACHNCYWVTLATMSGAI